MVNDDDDDDDEGETHPRPKKKPRGQRSRTGCAECRQRKIKCDESRPTCRQCLKAGRSCSIADSVFKPHVLSFETSNNASTSSRPRTTSDATTATAPVPTTSTQTRERLASSITVQTIAPVTSIPDGQDENGETTDPTQQTRNASDSSRAHESRTSPSANRSNTPQRDPPLTQYADSPHENQGWNYQQPSASTFMPNVRDVITSPNSSGPGLGPASFGATSNTAAQPFLSPTPLVTFSESQQDRYEEAFFLRHFSEHIAPWLDMVNFQRYFGHECIVLLRENSLLRFATCALAAKQLGQSSKSTVAAFHNRAQRNIAQILLQGNLSFIWYGAKYYDKAIKTLAHQIASRGNQVMQLSPSWSGVEGSFPQSEMMTRADGEDPIIRLLAACLLIQFENLSGNSKGWSGHLNGFNKLLTLLDDGSLFYTNPLTQRIFDAKSQRGLRAAFWWFVINDMEESFVRRKKMRIDLENTSLWRHMGLHTDESDQPLDLDMCETPDAPPHLQEDLLSFVLIRILCKLVNMLAPENNTTDGGIIDDAQGDTRIEFLQAIQSDLDNWIYSATAAFKPDSIWRPQTSKNKSYSEFSNTEMWYSHSFRAVTMLYYHMARMLLLIHQPPMSAQTIDEGHPFDLLRAVEMLRQKLRSHATDVIAITTGMVEDGAVRVRAVQPLYIAGRSLTEQKDRKYIIEKIRSIQDDLGVVCEYRVIDLMQEWSVSFESLGLPATRDETEFFYPS